MQKLLYPLTTELMTFVYLLNHTVERSLRRECDMSVVQYRTLSCLKQQNELSEAKIASILATSASQLSQGLSVLAGKNYIRSRTNQGPAKTIALTKTGKRALDNADLVLAEAVNAVFGPLGEELGGAIRSGSMLTNQRHGIVRVEEGSFFEEHACFEAFLEAERISKKATQDYGLTYTQFRILFEMLCAGPMSQSYLAKRLQLSPSVISDACVKLHERGLIADTHAANDKRIRIFSLTESGRDLAEVSAIHVDRRCFEDIRPSSDAERTLYQRMADIVAR